MGTFQMSLSLFFWHRNLMALSQPPVSLHSSDLIDMFWLFRKESQDDRVFSDSILLTESL